MKKTILSELTKPRQYLVSFILIAVVSAICHFLSVYMGYKTVAFLLLVTVSFLAMFFDILPVLLSALVSALIWDFLFIPPVYKFHVGNTEDLLMLLMYFIVALINASLTFKIRQIEKISRQREEKANTIRLYNTLLNSLSHELRTPISTIIGASDNLMTNPHLLTDVNKKELLEEISKASLQLNRQVGNLLNMSRLESGSITLHNDWCDINEMIYNVINRLEDNLKKHKIHVQIQKGLPYFKLDMALMEQVLHNLIYNAVLYTSAGSSIKIKAACVNEKFILVVEDNGPGFPEGETEKVFDKFYRLNNSKPGGTGLGLSIVKGFVEAHHGKIYLENIIPHGARFTVEIPAETTYINNLKNE